VAVGLGVAGGHGGGVGEAGADVVGVELVDGALVTGLGGVVALGQPADDEESVALVQGLGGVLGQAAPAGDGQVDGVAVLPLPGRVVLVAVVDGDPEVDQP